MASSVIHMVIANEINKTLHMDQKKLLLGSIAPDIAKLVGDTKNKSHFIKDEKDIPVMDDFINKYGYYMDDPFVTGYYIHLYTDYLWFKYFMSEIDFNTSFKNLKGEYIPCNEDSFLRFVYDDYTSLNPDLIDKYNLDLSIFYEGVFNLRNIIEEIPMDNIKILIDKTGIIIANSKKGKSVVFNLDNINTFIKSSVELILSEIEKI